MVDKETRMGAIRALQQILMVEGEHYDAIVGAVAGLTSFAELGDGRERILDKLSGLRIDLDCLRDWGFSPTGGR